MLKTKQELKRTLEYEFRLYFSEKADFMKKLLQNRNKIWKYVKLLRKYEYYYNNSEKIFSKLFAIYYREKKNKLGYVLGFEIGPNVFNKGLHIYHTGSIIINGTAKVGENCTILGITCLGNRGGGCGPHIGNNCELGINSIVIGNIIIGNNVFVGAGAIVTKSVIEDNVAVAGIPATIIKRYAV